MTHLAMEAMAHFQMMYHDEYLPNLNMVMCQFATFNKQRVYN